MKLSAAFDFFLKDSLARGLSPFTVRWYRQYIGRLISYFNDRDLDDLSSADLREFVADLRTNPKKYERHQWRKPVNANLSPSTVYGYVGAIKAFFNWLETNEYISAQRNIARRLKKPKLPKVPPKASSDDDLRAILKAARECSTHPKRDYALILFLASTGCRIRGLINLRLPDLELDKRRALVTEKGDKTRKVFLVPEAKAALKDWLAERPEGTDFVFVSQHNKPFSPFGVRQIFKRLKAKAGVTGPVNPHSHRHGFAKRFIKSGGSLGVCSDLMGHSDVNVTKRFYSVFTDDELKHEYDEHSPLRGIVGDD